MKYNQFILALLFLAFCIGSSSAQKTYKGHKIYKINHYYSTISKLDSVKDCRHYLPLRRTIYIIQDNSYAGEYFAQQRVMALRDAGFRADYFWLPCYGIDVSRYCVYVERFCNSRSTAEEKYRKHLRRARKKGIQAKQVYIRSLKKQ